MPVPRELADLPYGRHLDPFHGELDREGDYNTIHFEGDEFEEGEGGNSRFTECAFTQVAFIGGAYRRARFNDVWLHTVRWVGTDLVETVWLDAEVIASALSGVQMFSSELRRMTFFNCKFDSVNFRTATLQAVSFVDCLLRDIDFGGATLTVVTFAGSALDEVRFGKARLQKVDLRGATSLGIRDGVEALQGATITTMQLLDLAPMFAQAIGVTVQDH